MKKNRIIIILSVCMLVSACSALRFPGVYRIDIAQGNFVTEDMLARLETGMTPEQVQYVMGVPTLVDPFTPDAWYYLMTFQPGQRDDYSQQEIVVHFDNARFSHVQGELIDDFRLKVQGQQEKALESRIRESRVTTK